MTTPTQSFFHESVERSAHQHQVQMWRAAQTVRSHVPAGDGLDAMLDCLGLTDATCPADRP